MGGGRTHGEEANDDNDAASDLTTLEADVRNGGFNVTTEICRNNEKYQ